MPSYEQWNKALFEYVITGVPRGARVYLAIDDDVIEFIAFQLNTRPDDFWNVLRTYCKRNKSIDFSHISSQALSQENYTQSPPYIAFLGAMVVAAYRMGESVNQGVASHDYFHYFNGLLGFPVDFGRPPGMAHGSEQVFWDEWNIWLRYHGYQPTAFKTADHYYTYALSQAL